MKQQQCKQPLNYCLPSRVITPASSAECDVYWEESWVVFPGGTDISLLLDYCVFASINYQVSGFDCYSIM